MRIGTGARVLGISTDMAGLLALYPSGGNGARSVGVTGVLSAVSGIVCKGGAREHEAFDP